MVVKEAFLGTLSNQNYFAADALETEHDSGNVLVKCQFCVLRPEGKNNIGG